MTVTQLLLVEDRARTRERIGEALRASGYAVKTAGDGAEALAVLQQGPVDLVLSDYRMTPINGLELLRTVRRDLAIPFILYSAGADAEVVFQAGRDGAVRFLEYPFRIEDQLLPTIVECLAGRRVPKATHRFGAERFVGGSVEAHRVRAQIHRVAQSRATLLVTGETGTGKDLVARAVHEESGRGTFVAVAVTELAEGLMESELFGHERGAFTGATQRRSGLFAAASGGTLFLDEIGDAPPSVQAKLLRVLETGSVRPVGGDRVNAVDTRVIAATHRDLGELTRCGEFRQDLLFRIRQTNIHLPPLRERPADVESIARAALEDLAFEARLAVPCMSAAFISALRSHPWRGNVRELRAVLQNAVLSWDTRSELGLGDLLESLAMLEPRLGVEDQAVCQRMLDAYRRSSWNQEASRRELGMSRGAWRHQWQRLGLDSLTRRRR